MEPWNMLVVGDCMEEHLSNLLQLDATKLDHWAKLLVKWSFLYYDTG